MKRIEMISILVPSRGRPKNIERLYKSLEATTEGRWELLVRIDSDDETMGDYRLIGHWPSLLLVIDERRLLSQLWNELFPYALGDIVGLVGDDVTFQTQGWDVQVRQAFPEDKMAVVHGNDLSPNAAKIGTHPFVSVKWVEALTYLCPPYFSADYNDLWLCEVADALGRRVYLPDLIMEHHHPAFDKAELDLTHQERIERHRADDMDRVWRETADKRAEDVAKLQAIISGYDSE